MSHYKIATFENNDVWFDTETLSVLVGSQSEPGARCELGFLSQCSDIALDAESIALLDEYIKLVHYVRDMKTLSTTGQLNIRTALANHFISPELTRQYTIWEQRLFEKIELLFQ